MELARHARKLGCRCHCNNSIILLPLARILSCQILNDNGSAASKTQTMSSAKDSSIGGVALTPKPLHRNVGKIHVLSVRKSASMPVQDIQAFCESLVEKTTSSSTVQMSSSRVVSLEPKLVSVVIYGAMPELFVKLNN